MLATLLIAAIRWPNSYRINDAIGAVEIRNADLLASRRGVVDAGASPATGDGLKHGASDLFQVSAPVIDTGFGFARDGGI